MLVPIFGTPSALSYATLQMVRVIVEETYGAHSLLQAVFMNDLKTAWNSLDRAARKFVIFFSDCPHPEVTALMLATKAPIIVIADDIANIVGYTIETRGMEFPHAVRFATQVTSALDALFGTVQVMRVTPDRYKRDLRSLVAEVIDFFGFSCEPEQFDAILKRLGGSEDEAAQPLAAYIERTLPVVRIARDYLHDLSEDRRQVLQSLTRQYSSIMSGRSLSVLDWPTSLFLDWERPGVFLERTIELTGPARFIICGPYLHLPAGCWNVEVQIETRECHSENLLAVDVFSGNILSAVSMRLAAEGAYAFDIAFETIDPLLPVELRFQLLRGSIEGQLTLLGVRLTRQPPDDNA